MESMTGFFHLLVWDLLLLGIDTRLKGPSAFSVSSERHGQGGVNEMAQVSVEAGGFEPQSPRPKA